MKKNNLKKVFVTALITVFQFSDMIAKSRPPAPRGSGGFGDDVVVGGSIDSSLMLLFFMALIFGSVMISKIKSMKLSTK